MEGLLEIVENEGKSYWLFEHNHVTRYFVLIQQKLHQFPTKDNATENSANEWTVLSVSDWNAPNHPQQTGICIIVFF